MIVGIHKPCAVGIGALIVGSLSCDPSASSTPPVPAPTPDVTTSAPARDSFEPDLAVRDSSTTGETVEIDVAAALWPQFQPEELPPLQMKSFPMPEPRPPEVVGDCATDSDCALFERDVDGPSGCCLSCKARPASSTWVQAAEAYCETNAPAHCSIAECPPPRRETYCYEHSCRSRPVIDARLGAPDYACRTDADCVTADVSLRGTDACCPSRRGEVVSRSFASRIARSCRDVDTSGCERLDGKFSTLHRHPTRPGCVDMRCVPVKVPAEGVIDLFE